MDSVKLMWILGEAANIYGVYKGNKTDCVIMIHATGGQPIRVKRANLEAFLSHLEKQGVARESMVETTEEAFQAYMGSPAPVTYDWTGQ